ncbi:hypothetical protein CA12_10870 [Alienimonas californiensis]|uniref:Uncharacterized protein n=1 Tax=Alienimonas californiensis TaxID=2527989 RepID=A0A517P6K7_9PLAN|nr:hypothetical protein CA12_10870 [Alienimonas californiensis]
MPSASFGCRHAGATSESSSLRRRRAPCRRLSAGAARRRHATRWEACLVGAVGRVALVRLRQRLAALGATGSASAFGSRRPGPVRIVRASPEHWQSQWHTTGARHGCGGRLGQADRPHLHQHGWLGQKGGRRPPTDRMPQNQQCPSPLPLVRTPPVLGHPLTLLPQPPTGRPSGPLCGPPSPPTRSAQRTLRRGGRRPQAERGALRDGGQQGGGAPAGGFGLSHDLPHGGGVVGGQAAAEGVDQQLFSQGRGE